MDGTRLGLVDGDTVDWTYGVVDGADAGSDDVNGPTLGMIEGIADDDVDDFDDGTMLGMIVGTDDGLTAVDSKG